MVGLKNSVIASNKMEGLNPPPVTDQKNSKVTLNVDSCVASVPIVTGLPQRKGVNPNACQLYTKIKYVKNVFCVGHLSSVNLVTNAQHAVIDPLVGARLQQCWEKWETLGSSPKVVNILREGYTLPFRFRPHLTRSPTVISNYHNPTKQSFLLEALYQLLNKNAVEPVENQNSLGFYNRLFLVPKPNNRWRPILDLSTLNTLNTFLNTETFKMETPDTQDQINIVGSALPGPTIHVPHRSTQSNRKASPLRATTHETHTVALEKQLEGPRITGKGDTGSQVPPPPSKVVAGGKQCATRSTIKPSKTCSADLYRRIKRRVGRSLGRPHCKRNLVPSREQITHKPLRAKSGISSSKGVSNPGLQQDSVDSYRQHNSGCLYQQRGGDEVGVSVCPTVENPVVVHQTAGNPQSTSHPRPAERDSRQAIQTWPDHSNRVVTSSSSVPGCMLKVAPATSGPVCHQVQQQTATVCITGTRHPGLGSGCTQPLLGGPGPIRLPTGSHLGQSGGEAPGLPLQQNNSDCSRVAQHALILGPGSNVKPDPTVSAQHTQPSVSAIQPGPSQEPVESEPICPAPRASAIKEQGFSEEVAARIEAPQRRSTRSVYEAKWTIFTKWCLSNQVDFRAPPLKAIADFLLHLFQEKKLQPGTIGGYRSAIADKLGNSTINVSKDENLTRLLDSFHRDRPKGRRGIPSWNLSLVLHQLTKAPFEPLKEASLKHLTFKTVFLLALGSGKRRSEIHAWLHKNIRHQSDWSKVSLYPSPSFLSKNQLAKEGPDSVAPVVIPALAPSLDRSLKGDRSLCPVRALRYYLDRTADLRQNKELVFVSFKKGFDKDISPATISSWIKQTVVLCYELSDQEALTLHQVSIQGSGTRISGYPLRSLVNTLSNGQLAKKWQNTKLLLSP